MSEIGLIRKRRKRKNGKQCYQKNRRTASIAKKKEKDQQALLKTEREKLEAEREKSEREIKLEKLELKRRKIKFEETKLYLEV